MPKNCNSRRIGDGFHRQPDAKAEAGVHEEMDRRAIACFDQALEDVGLSANEQLRQVLHDYFAWATTTTMAQYHESADDVPKGLRIPRWSWDGLQG